MKTRLSVLALLLAALMGVGTAAHAQITPYPVVLTMTGPATAVSGQEISYRVHYRLTDPSAIVGPSFVIGIPRNTTYVSSQVVSGPPGSFVVRTASPDSPSVEWSERGRPGETEGVVEFTFRIDNGFVGLIRSSCYIRGTQTANPESRCSAETQVFAPGTLPETGSGGLAAGSGSHMALVALGLMGAALVCAGAVTRRMRRAR